MPMAACGRLVRGALRGGGGPRSPPRGPGAARGASSPAPAGTDGLAVATFGAFAGGRGGLGRAGESGRSGRSLSARGRDLDGEMNLGLRAVGVG